MVNIFDDEIGKARNTDGPKFGRSQKKKSQQHVKSNTLKTKERSKKRHLTSNTQYIWTGKTQPNRLFRIMILNYMPKRINSRHLGLDTNNSEILNDITMLSNGISVNNTFVGSFVRVCSLMLFFLNFGLWLLLGCVALVHCWKIIILLIFCFYLINMFYCCFVSFVCSHSRSVVQSISYGHKSPPAIKRLSNKKFP